ncbi:MAG: transposase [Elainellaceae cyanobacterium]
MRWPDGAVQCPQCDSHEVVRDKDDAHPHRQRYGCKSYQRQFDDLSGTVFAGRQQPLRVWMGCL